MVAADALHTEANKLQVCHKALNLLILMAGVFSSLSLSAVSPFFFFFLAAVSDWGWGQGCQADSQTEPSSSTFLPQWSPFPAFFTNPTSRASLLYICPFYPHFQQDAQVYHIWHHLGWQPLIWLVFLEAIGHNCIIHAHIQKHIWDALPLQFFTLLGYTVCVCTFSPLWLKHW